MSKRKCTRIVCDSSFCWYGYEEQAVRALIYIYRCVPQVRIHSYRY